MSTQENLKTFTSQINQIDKKHKQTTDLIKEAHYDLALLKAITKYEKKTTTRPEEVYIENIQKRISSIINELNNIYKNESN